VSLFNPNVYTPQRPGLTWAQSIVGDGIDSRFAIVGNFEDALLCWRSQAARWTQPEEGIVLASGAGALGVRLGDPIPGAAAPRDRPPLGSGEAAREDALASLEGLLWRALIVWSIVYLLAAALQLA